MAGIDPYGELIDFPSHAEAVTASDTDTTSNVPPGTRFLMVGVTGDVKVKMKSGAIVILRNLQIGQWHHVRCTHVYSTDTEASEIVAGA